MKHIAMLAILVGLFFGTLTSVAALPPLQYYVRWATPPVYSCAYSSFYGEYEMKVQPTQLAYLAPQIAQMTETDIVDNSDGHYVGSEDTLTNWMNLGGTRAHSRYDIESVTYPITLKVILTTYLNGAGVYQSTFLAKCTGSSTAALSATVTNIIHPPTFGIWQPGSVGTNP